MSKAKQRRRRRVQPENPNALGRTAVKTINEILCSVALSQKLSAAQKEELWLAIQASKRKRHVYAVWQHFKGSASDLKLLRIIEFRCGEMKRLLSEYGGKRMFVHPDGKTVNLAPFLATLDEIRAVAARTALREKTMASFRPKGSLGEFYVGHVLADVYEKTFKRPATPTIPANGPGPFIRFVLAVHKAQHLPAPSPASVRTWRNRYELKRRGA